MIKQYARVDFDLHCPEIHGPARNCTEQKPTTATAQEKSDNDLRPSVMTRRPHNGAHDWRGHRASDEDVHAAVRRLAREFERHRILLRVQTRQAQQLGHRKVSGNRWDEQVRTTLSKGWDDAVLPKRIPTRSLVQAEDGVRVQEVVHLRQ